MLLKERSRALFMGCVGIVALLFAGQSPASYETPFDPALGDPAFITDRVHPGTTHGLLNVIGFRRYGVVKLLAFGGAFSGTNTTFKLGGDEFDVHFTNPFRHGVRISATIWDYGGHQYARGYTSIKGKIFDTVPGTTGTPRGKLFSAKIVGVDTDLTDLGYGSNTIAFDTKRFRGWASQFGNREPLLLQLFHPVTGAPMDFPDLNWFHNGYYSWGHMDDDDDFEYFHHHHHGNFFFAKASAIQVVPLPAGLPLLASGLIGFTALSRRRQRGLAPA